MANKRRRCQTKTPGNERKYIKKKKQERIKGNLNKQNKTVHDIIMKVNSVSRN